MRSLWQTAGLISEQVYLLSLAGQSRLHLLITVQYQTTQYINTTVSSQFSFLSRPIPTRTTLTGASLYKLRHCIAKAPYRQLRGIQDNESVTILMKEVIVTLHKSYIAASTPWYLFPVSVVWYVAGKLAESSSNHLSPNPEAYISNLLILSAGSYHFAGIIFYN